MSEKAKFHRKVGAFHLRIFQQHPSFLYHFECRRTAVISTSAFSFTSAATEGGDRFEELLLPLLPPWTALRPGQAGADRVRPRGDHQDHRGRGQQEQREDQQDGGTTYVGNLAN